ncbi:MAG: hypothetical protein M3O02_07310, partial [Acidobacteriota bacterium]|nr:hypothetical protein [Acidobacteriota bacterium]
MQESTPFDNPLMPNARLRQMYLAIMRVQAVEQSLGPKQRCGVLGREACLVAATIGLGPGDRISDTLHGPAMRFLRGQPLDRALHPELRSRRRPVLAECGPAASLPDNPATAERLWL